MSDRDWDGVSYARSSRYRRVVLEALYDRPSMPSEIAAKDDDDIAHISRAISELRERDYVELLVPEDTKKGRIYGLTDEGAALVEDLEVVA